MQADKQQHNLAQAADAPCSHPTEKPHSWKAEAEAFQTDPLPTLRRIKTGKAQSSTAEPSNSDERVEKAVTRPEKQPSTEEQPLLSKHHQESVTEASKQPPAPIGRQQIPKADRKARKLARPIPLPPSPTEESARVAHTHFKDAQPKESKDMYGTKVQPGRSSLQHAVQVQEKAPANPVKPSAGSRRPEIFSSYSMSTPRPQPRQSPIQRRLPYASTQSAKVEPRFKDVQMKGHASSETPWGNKHLSSHKLEPDHLPHRALAGSSCGSDSSLDILLDSPGKHKPGSMTAAVTSGRKGSGSFLSSCTIPVA